jgi:hypothetical protein
MIKPVLRLPGALSVVALLLFSTCKKDDGLPPATQEGKNTFGCKVDGKVWIPNGGPGFMGAKPIEGGFTVIYDTPERIGFELTGNNKDGERISIFINDYKVGNYFLNQKTNILPFTLIPKNYGYYLSKTGILYVTDDLNLGQVTISCSGRNIDGICSGSFEFDAGNSKNPKDVVKISSGRFDINVRTL